MFEVADHDPSDELRSQDWLDRQVIAGMEAEMIGRKRSVCLIGILGLMALTCFQGETMAQLPDTVLFGVAYYDEYTPVNRVEEDAKMMKAAGITVVRIAESTWGTLEPQPGVRFLPYRSHTCRDAAKRDQGGPTGGFFRAGKPLPW
jgi:hypothetical protein